MKQQQQRHSPANRPLARDLRAARTTRSSPMESAALREKSASRAVMLPRAADVTPTFVIPAAVRAVAVVNERVAWTVDVDGGVQIRALPKGTVVKHVDMARTKNNNNKKDNAVACCVLYLPTLQRIWVAFRDGSLRIYDATTGQLMKELAGRHRGPVHCLLALEDTVCLGGSDWRVHQYEAETAQYRRLFFGHAGAVRCLGAYNGPTGAVLFSGSDDATIKAWNPYALPPQRNPAGATTTVAVVEGVVESAPNSTSKRYRSLSSNSHAEEEEEDNEEDETGCLYTFQGHNRAVLALEVVPHAHQLWSGGEDTTVRVWDLSTLQLSKTLTGHTAPVSCLLAVESRMWSGDKQSNLLLWDMSSLSGLKLLTRHSQGLSATPPPLGPMLSMTKLELCTAWRVWTSHSQGWVQSWCAETQPIVLEKEPVIPSSGNGSKPTEADASRGSSTGGAAWRQSHSSADVVTLHSPNALGLLSSPAAMEGSAMAWMQAEIEQYMQRLQTELNATKQELAFSYEQARKEVQHELVLQQLLMEENAMLKAQLQQSQTEQVPHADKETLTTDEPVAAADTAPTPLPAKTASPQATPNEASKTTTITNAKPSTQVNSGRASGRKSLITSHHRRRFAGGNWAYLLTEKPHELYSTFRDEVSTAFGVPASQLSNIRFHEGSLIAELDVRHSASISAEEMARRLREYDFARLLELHEQALVKPKVGLDAAQDTLRHLERAVRQTTHALQRVTSSPQPSTADKHDETAVPDRDVAPTQAELQLLRDENAALQRILLQDHSGLTTATATEGPVSVSDLSSAVTPIDHVTRGTQYETSQAVRHADKATLQPRQVSESETNSAADMQALKERLVAREDERRTVKAQLAHMRDENAQLHVQLEALTEASQAPQQEEDNNKAQPIAQPTLTGVNMASQTIQNEKKEPATQEEEQQQYGKESDEAMRALREDHNALDDYLHMRLKPLISRLKRTRGEKEYLLGKLEREKSALEDELRQVRAELHAAREEQPQADLHNSPPPRSPHRNTATTATRDTQRDDREVKEPAHVDHLTHHDEVTTPLHESAARRTASQQVHSARASALMQAAEAELAALDRVSEQQRRAASETMPDVVDQLKAAHAEEQQQQHQVVGDEGDEAMRALREDYAALEQYVHMRLKPLISRLKRARGERDVLLAEADKRYATLLELYNATRSPDARTKKATKKT